VNSLNNILQTNNFSVDNILHLLSINGDSKKKLFETSNYIKTKVVGNKVYLRGLIEYSNICEKNCYYCGIRNENKNIERYFLSEKDVVEAAKFAFNNNYGSIVIQAGELTNKNYVNKIDKLIYEIKKNTSNNFRITLSLGEQKTETLKQWFNTGAERYLIRIETSNNKLYNLIHPNNQKHDFNSRLQCLYNLKSIGYQVGTGVMIGLPFQSLTDLANDILFMKDIDIDMCGMGPYIEHNDTPLYKSDNILLNVKERFDLTLKMIAVLRIVMKDINIASTTALQAIDKVGREKAIKVGANVIMPNITPIKYRQNYKLYENKPCINDSSDDCKNCLETRIHIAGAEIGYGENGDSQHFIKTKNILNKSHINQI